MTTADNQRVYRVRVRDSIGEAPMGGQAYPRCCWHGAGPGCDHCDRVGLVALGKEILRTRQNLERAHHVEYMGLREGYHHHAASRVACLICLVPCHALTLSALPH